MVSLRRNLSALDRSIRIALGLVALVLAAAVPMHGHDALALAIFAWVPLVTALVGWCPIYELFGISTRGR